MNVVFEIVGNTLLIVQGRHDPSNEEWRRFIRRLAPQVSSLDQAVVVTLGGVVNAYQRQLGIGLMQHMDRRILVTSSPAVRAVAMAFSWLGLPFETVTLSGLRDAFESLGETQARVARLLRVSEALLREVDPVGLAALPIGGVSSRA